MALNWLERKSLGLFVKTGGILSRSLFGGIAHIFMLHRILPGSERERYTFNKGLAITPDTLRKHIRFFKSLGYRFISMDTLADLLEEKLPLKGKYICLSLDDGYQDNFTHGLPVFEDEETPVTVYVTTCFPNNSAIFWWYALEELLIENEEIRFGNETCRASTPEEKSVVFHQLRRKILDLPQGELMKLLPDLLGIPLERLQLPERQLAADWNMLRYYAQHPLVDLGAHTVNHLPLARLSEEQVLDEMVRSRDEIEERTGAQVRHFAYPYGGLDDVSIRNMQLAQHAGFRTAVLNHPGNIFTDHHKSRMALPRYPLGEETALEELNYILNGIRHFSVNGWRKCLHYR